MSMTTDMGPAKRRAREAGRAALAGLDAARRAEGSTLISARLGAWDPFVGARTVMVYLPFGSPPDEPQLNELVTLARGMAKTVAAPRIGWNAGTMDAVELSFDEHGEPRTVVRRHGVPEPLPGAGRLIAPGEIDLILVPGLAFDLQGGRVGRGAGFYDRWLGSVPPGPRRATTVGVCFDVQVLADLPMDSHDVRMDAVMTERRLIVP